MGGGWSPEPAKMRKMCEFPPSMRTPLETIFALLWFAGAFFVLHFPGRVFERPPDSFFMFVQWNYDYMFELFRMLWI